MENKKNQYKLFRAKQEIAIKELYDEMNTSGFYQTEITDMLFNIIIENHGKNYDARWSVGEKMLEVLKIIKCKIHQYRKIISFDLESSDGWSLDKRDVSKRIKKNAENISCENNVIYLEDLKEK